MSNADLMTVNEVAARWKLGHLAVRRRILDGKLSAVRLGRFVRIPLASVQEYERTEFTPMVATPTNQAALLSPSPATTTPTPEPITTPAEIPAPPPTVDFSREARQARRRRVVEVCGDAVRSGKLSGKALEKLAIDAGIRSEAGTALIAETIRTWVRQADEKV